MIEMLSDKILYVNAPDFVHPDTRNQFDDDQDWAKKLLNIYRNLRQMEKRKYHGDGFSSQLRQLASYYAVKYKMWIKTRLETENSKERLGSLSENAELIASG